jgi:DNA-binding transcriptional LysR family regulator
VDKLTGMNVFVRVAKAESFAGAARDLGISRSMVTKHVMQLEHTLGTRLFNRTTRSLSLTEAGASYLGRCRQVLADIEEMEEAITHLQSEPRGRIKISAPHYIGAAHIAPALAEFLSLYPELSVNMLLQGAPGDLVDEAIDIAIVLGALDDTSLIARKLASSPLVVCGSPSYFAKYGVPEKPEDLVEHSCLVNWAIPPRNQWQFRGNGKIIEVKVSGRMQANAADPIRIAADKGLGLLMLPSYIVGRDIEKGKLQVVLSDYMGLPLDINAVYPHRKYLSAKVRIFLKFLQTWLKGRVDIKE